MLREEAVVTANELAEKLAEKGITLEVVPNTPLASLMKCTDRTPMMEISTNDPAIRTVLTNVVRSTNYRPEGQTGFSQHDMMHNEAAQLAANAVRNHVMIVKTMVIPAIKSLYEKTMLELQEMRASELNDFEIVKYDIPLPLRHASFNELMSAHAKNRYSEASAKDNRLKVGGGYSSDMNDLLLTGVPSIDKDITGWLAGHDQAWVPYVWAKYLQSDNHIHAPNSVTGSATPEDKASEMLILFLLTRTLADRDPIDNSNLALSDYQMRVKTLRQQAAAYLTQSLERWNRLIKQQIIVMTQKGKTVTVCEPVYRKWLAECEQSHIEPTDVLFGNLLSNKHYISVKDLDSNAVSLQRAWIKHVGNTTLAARTTRFIHTRRILQRQFITQLNEDLESQNANLLGETNKEVVMSRFRTVLESFTERDLDDIQYMVERLVCRSRFPQTDAESFLNDMKSISVDNPNMPQREVATVAALNYLAQWGMSMITTRKYRV